MRSFFFRKLQLITVLLLIRDSYMSWSTRFDSLKKRVGFFIFDSVLFLLKFTEFELLYKIHFAVISHVQWGYQRRRRKFHNFATLLGNFFFWVNSQFWILFTSRFANCEGQTVNSNSDLYFRSTKSMNSLIRHNSFQN